MKLKEILQQMEDLQKKIGSSPAFICGGTARSKYLNTLQNISDLDITNGDKSISYLSIEFYNLLKNKFNIARKEMDDGHSTIFLGNIKIDFSSNFITPGIIQILSNIGIRNSTDLQKEMFSRDFTCNSLLMTLDLKKIMDPTNKGFNDLNNKIIKTCLSPEITLTTNKNRVARSIYLSSKLDFDVDQSIIDFVKKNPQSINISSKKSVIEKLNDAFKYNPDRAIYLLDKMGLWNYIPITDSIYPYYIKRKNG